MMRLRDLGAKEQAIIRLHFFEDQTFKDIALTLELSENTVKTTHYRSLKKLEAALNGECKMTLEEKRRPMMAKMPTR